MMNQSSALSICIVGFLATVGCIGICLMDTSTSKSTYLNQVQTEETSTNTCSVSNGQKVSGNGMQHLEDETFYFVDYQNSESDTLRKACEYANNSSDDYYLEYIEDSPGNRIGISFQKVTVETDFNNGIILGE